MLQSNSVSVIYKRMGYMPVKQIFNQAMIGLQINFYVRKIRLYNLKPNYDFYKYIKKFTKINF